MGSIANVSRAAALVGLTALVAAEPAIAGLPPVPGPLLAAGAPALIVFGAGYYVLRKFRNR